MHIEKIYREVHRELDKHYIPTLGLELILLLVHASVIITAFFMYRMPFYFLIPLMLIQTFVVFLMFTPIHEGVHFLASKSLSHTFNGAVFLLMRF